MDYFWAIISDALKFWVDALLQIEELNEMIPSVSGTDILWIWIIVLPKAWGIWGIIADIIIIIFTGYNVIIWLDKIITSIKHFIGIYD